MHTELVLANETVLRPGSSSQVVGAAVAVGRRAWEERRVDVGRAHGDLTRMDEHLQSLEDGQYGQYLEPDYDQQNEIQSLDDIAYHLTNRKLLR